MKKAHNNQLCDETSPYLLQHAHNPVDWYAWKEAAFAKARAEDKPILVSIGYSTCHWCHVMERESFEDEQVAAFMNAHFVNIKVDREERPDVDQIYMEACQVISGGGGWPLNCFLTPDGRPFFAGTYYPPQPMYNRPSWLQILENLAVAFKTKRTVVEEQADKMTEIIRGSDEQLIKRFTKKEGAGSTLEDFGSGLREIGLLNKSFLTTSYKGLERQFDREAGGFGGAPKFPGSMNLAWLLEYNHYTQEADAVEHALLSLDKMIMGGIYDQIGGGFSRYATDKFWLVPHFEKMLYDNALIVSVLADAYKITKHPLYQETIEETLGFVLREMTDPEGGFYSAYDADSEGVEGKYYVWTKEEVEAVLGPNAALFCSFYDVTSEGNWEEHSILHREACFEAFAENKGLNLDVLKQTMSDCRRKLYETRSGRIKPGLDDKILLSWNALMVSAFAKSHEAKFKVQSPKSKVGSPESGVRSRESEVQSP